MTIQAVIFDLDNTLINRRAAFEKYTYALIDRFLRVSGEEDRVEKANYIILADQDGYRPKRELYEEIHSSFEMKDDTTRVQDLLDYWFDEFFKCTLLMKGTLEVLEHCKSLKLPLGLITNGSIHSQNSKIDYAGIRHYFDCVLVSDEVGIKKPDPRIFQLALEHLGVAAEHSMYVGDHPINDVAGAQEAGLRSVWLRGFTTEAPPALKPHYTIDDLSELLALLK